MKKSMILAAVAAATLSMVGCDKDEPKVDYLVVLEVKNDTGKEIVLTNAAAVNAQNMEVKIGAGATGSTNSKLYSGPVESSSPKDNLKDDDVLPFGDAFITQLPEGEAYWVYMTVGGEAVSGKVWTRKHWTFRADGRNRVYSLTVTDKFLADLEPAPAPAPAPKPAQ